MAIPSKKIQQRSWKAAAQDYGLGLVLGAVGLTLAFASIEGRITDDRALYENLSEIRGRKQKDLSFDGDIAALSRAEARFREKRLPKPRAKNVARRSALNGPKARASAPRRVPSPRRATATQWNGNARARS